MIGRPYHSDPGLNHQIPEEFQVLGYPILSIRSIPKDTEYLGRFFKEEIAKGKDPLDINDVWPENYSVNSSQKVWAAKFAARHPNVVVLDLSSFKCGHDAPTYGLIDSIIDASGTPYAALHDIDANKPGGSIKIRVKTYAHSLKLHEERLSDLSQKKAELQFSLDKKRFELLEMKRAQHASPELDAQLTELSERIRAYQAPKRAPEQPKDLLKLGKKRADGGVDRIDIKGVDIPTPRTSHHQHVDLSAPEISPAEPTVVEIHMPAAE
jgi:hypothetical protein